MQTKETNKNLARFRNSSLIFLTLYGLWKVEAKRPKPKLNAGVLSFASFLSLSLKYTKEAWTKKAWTEAAYFLQEKGLINISQIDVEDGTPTIVISGLGCAIPETEFKQMIKWLLNVVEGKPNWHFNVDPLWKKLLNDLFEGKVKLRNPSNG